MSSAENGRLAAWRYWLSGAGFGCGVGIVVGVLTQHLHIGWS